MTEEPAHDVFASGDVVDGRYRIVRLLGKGGMGAVYEIEALDGGERLALKTLITELVEHQKSLDRLQHEYRLSRRLSHPNLLKIYEVFEVEIELPGGQRHRVPCMVMELLRGKTLADHLIAGWRATPDEARPLACQIAAALAAAHDADIVHRDLKPDNVFLEPAGDVPRVVLTDFGVARDSVAPTRDEATTASNVILGTAEYMAPEQLELEKATVASDIYTFGLVIYEIILGRRPFEDDVVLKAIFKRVEEEPHPPREVMPDLDPRWEEVILRCLRRQPEERYPSAAHVLRALGCEAWVEVPRDRARQLRQLGWALVTLALAGALAAGIGWLRG